MGDGKLALITEEYRKLNAEAHKDPNYGRAARFHGAMVQEVIDGCKALSLLDYGCGKQALRDVIQIPEYRGYDPAIPGLHFPPEPAELVYVGDVMEHVEPECEDDVVAHVMGLAQKAAIFVISCHPGTRKLSDGKLAHRNVHVPKYWRRKLARHGFIEEFDPVASKPEVRLVVWK